jgi:hypothetical protein
MAAVNRVPILGHQDPGGTTEQTVRRLMQLRGTMAPARIISLFEIGAATFAMADQHDHIHVGFQPMLGANKRLGKPALALLKPGQWSDLLSRLRDIENPVVPTQAVQVSAARRRQADQRRARRIASAQGRPPAPWRAPWRVLRGGSRPWRRRRRSRWPVARALADATASARTALRRKR